MKYGRKERGHCTGGKKIPNKAQLAPKDQPIELPEGRESTRLTNLIYSLINGPRG